MLGRGHEMFWHLLPIAFTADNCVHRTQNQPGPIQLGDVLQIQPKSPLADPSLGNGVSAAQRSLEARGKTMVGLRNMDPQKQSGMLSPTGCIEGQDGFGNRREGVR